MKSLILSFTMVLMALLSFGKDPKLSFYVNLLPSQKVATPTTVLGSANDVSAYKGNALFLINIGDGSAAATNVVTLSHSATGDGAYATITNTAGVAAIITNNSVTNALSSYSCDSARLNKYVKAGYTTTGTNTAVGVILVTPMKSQ